MKPVSSLTAVVLPAIASSEATGLGADALAEEDESEPEVVLEELSVPPHAARVKAMPATAVAARTRLRVENIRFRSFVFG